MASGVLTQRVGWLAAVIQRMAAGVITARWTGQDLAVLAGGRDATGTRLPAKGWMALRRLGWTATAPDGVWVSDRVRRIAEEEAARALRLAVHREAIIAGLLASWPRDPGRRTAEEWAALWAAVPDGVDKATVRNRTRQVAAYHAEHGVLPVSVCDLEPAPRVAGQVALAAADRQAVRVGQPRAGQVTVWVQLPSTALPAGRRDWAWHALDLALPPTIPAEATLCTPTLRPGGRAVRVDLPWRQPIEAAPLTGHRQALGADWGLNTLLTATTAGLTPDAAIISSGRALRYDATGISRKLDRLRHHRERLATRIEHQDRLTTGHTTTDPGLHGKHQRLQVEHARV